MALEGRCMLVPWFLMASYAYYVLDRPLLADAEYDRMCRTIYLEWDELEHRHKHLIDRAGLRAGTGYYLAEADYPSIVKGSAERLLAQR